MTALYLLAGTSFAETDPEGFTQLLTGENAGLWKQCGVGGMNISNGVGETWLPASMPPNAHLGLPWFSKQAFSNFILRLEFKADKTPMNSGVHIGLPQPGQDPGKLIGSSLEIAIEQDFEKVFHTGSIWGGVNADPAHPTNRLASSSPLKPAGQWNEMDIAVNGREISVRLNGQIVNTYTASGPVNGYIGLETHRRSNPVSFRNVRIRDTSAAGLAASSTQKPAGAPAARPPETPDARPSAPPLPTNFDGMVLRPDWIARASDLRHEFMDNLVSYSGRLLDKQQRGKEKAGEYICAPFKWLMPLKDALKLLPTGMGQGSQSKIVNTCFPKMSLTSYSFTGSFQDCGFVFNQFILITDSKDQVVSVQFVHTGPKGERWRPYFGSPDGIKEPYYDYLKIKINASTRTQTVWYKVLPKQALIKMTLIKGPDVLDRGAIYGYPMEDVHWYLPPPLAGRFLDIADSYNSAPPSGVIPSGKP
jgi:hypothetical protein